MVGRGWLVVGKQGRAAASAAAACHMPHALRSRAPRVHQPPLCSAGRGPLAPPASQRQPTCSAAVANTPAAACSNPPCDVFFQSGLLQHQQPAEALQQRRRRRGRHIHVAPAGGRSGVPLLAVCRRLQVCHGDRAPLPTPSEQHVLGGAADFGEQPARRAVEQPPQALCMDRAGRAWKGGSRGAA